MISSSVASWREANTKESLLINYKISFELTIAIFDVNIIFGIFSGYSKKCYKYYKKKKKKLLILRHTTFQKSLKSCVTFIKRFIHIVCYYFGVLNVFKTFLYQYSVTQQAWIYLEIQFNSLNSML